MNRRGLLDGRELEYVFKTMELSVSLSIQALIRQR